MSDVSITGAFTYERATTSAYNADDLIVTGANFIEIWLDDEAIDYDIRIQVLGRSAIEKPVSAANSYSFQTNRGRTYIINVKTDSNANMQLLVG